MFPSQDRGWEESLEKEEEKQKSEEDGEKDQNPTGSRETEENSSQGALLGTGRTEGL